jgi:VanZ family protein
MSLAARLRAARLAYVAVVLLATLTGLRPEWSLAYAASHLGRMFDPGMGWRDAVDGLRNVALFAGMGAVWVVTAASFASGITIVRATAAGFALSMLVETAQLFSPVRIASMMDVGTNTFGAALGAWIVVAAIGAVRARKGAKSYLGVPAFALVVPAVLAAMTEAVTPLFKSEVQYTFGGPPARRFALAWAAAFPLRFSEIPFTDVLLFAPAGFLLVMLSGEREGGTERWARIGAAAAAAVAAVGIGHGVLGVAIRWEAIATDTLSIASGAWTARRWLGGFTRAYRGPGRARAAYAFYALWLVAWSWRPFIPSTSLHEILDEFTASHLIPLQALSSRVDAFSAFHVAQQFLLYLPLGCLLAVWPLRQRGPWSNLWPAIWLTLALELGHALIAARFLDVTNALIAISALGIGWVVIRRLGFATYGEAVS